MSLLTLYAQAELTSVETKLKRPKFLKVKLPTLKYIHLLLKRTKFGKNSLNLFLYLLNLKILKVVLALMYSNLLSIEENVLHHVLKIFYLLAQRHLILLRKLKSLKVLLDQVLTVQFLMKN